MAQKLTFSKVVILSFSRKPEGGTVKIACAPSKAVSKAMGWGEVPEWQKASTPTGSLAATLCEFQPTHTELSKHAFDLTTTQVNGFEFVRTQVKKGKTANKAPTFKLELHCSIDFNDAQGARKLEQYMASVPESAMKVTYEKAPEQEELLTTEEQRQAVLEEND